MASSSALSSVFAAALMMMMMMATLLPGAHADSHGRYCIEYTAYGSCEAERGCKWDRSAKMCYSYCYSSNYINPFVSGPKKTRPASECRNMSFAMQYGCAAMQWGMDHCTRCLDIGEAEYCIEAAPCTWNNASQKCSALPLTASGSSSSSSAPSSAHSLAPSSSSSSSDTNIGLIIGLSVGGFVLFLVIAIVVWYFYKRRRQNQGQGGYESVNLAGDGAAARATFKL